MNIEQLMPADELGLISKQDQQWLKDVFIRFGGYPNLEQMWALMDEQWEAKGCDSSVMDSRISEYYSHPVWLLNGLFIEQHKQSSDNRRKFRDWIVKGSPKKVAEFGGGFGGLARMVGAELPKAVVEVIEPHPHPLAVYRANMATNVRYRKEMSGSYDVIVATDVFEHVPDPLQLVYETAEHLRIGGEYLMANCFAPVIKCHLPQTFHFRHSWDAAIRALGLEPREKVAYGRVYVRLGNLDLKASKKVEQKSLNLWKLTRNLPGKLARPLTNLIT